MTRWDSVVGPDAEAGEPIAPRPLKRRRPGRYFNKTRLALALLAMGLAGVAFAYSQKDVYADNLADFSRQVIGDENTARLESIYFSFEDKTAQLKYRIFGGSANPFGESTRSSRFPAWTADQSLEDPQLTWLDVVAAPIAPLAPAPLRLPDTQPLRASLAAGEGVWTTDGLPRSTPDDVLMAKTFIRPDPTRPYASVGVLLLDKRRIRLHITGGTEDPGGDLGVKGPGLIPDGQRKDLLAAWNGGFKGPHGSYGMYADGKQYRPLRNGYASAVVMADGSIQIGEWGRDLTWSPEIVAVRQNAVLLVDNCQVSSRTGEGNNTWGYVEVNSSEFITWRSAIGVTKNGDLLVASGNSLSAATLAKALWAAGACYAMQLDINSPYVLTSLFFPQTDGSVKRTKFMESMPDNPGRFLNTQTRDFMYVTLDETNYKP